MKKLIFTLAFASLGTLCLKAVDLKEWTASLAERFKAEPVEMLSDEQMKEEGISQAQTYILEPEQIRQARSEAVGFPEDMNWLTVKADDADLNLYGTTDDSNDQAKMVVLMDAGGQSMMIYIEGDLSALDNILK